MAYFIDYLSSKLRPYKIFIIIAVVIIIFLTIGIIYAKSSTGDNKQKNLKFKDVANNGNRSSEIEIKMFHVDWCPHCKKALPDWQSFCDTYNGQNVNGFIIRCNRDGDNCTDDKDENINNIIKEYKIDSFPTVILLKEGERYDFDAKITKNALDQFVHSVTNE
jgi:thiol-disulfide isomerase/thioredoxin